MYFFSKKDIRDHLEKVNNCNEEIQKVFKSMFENEAVSLSVTSTTKSKEAFRTRMNSWAKILSNILGSRIESPL